MQVDQQRFAEALLALRDRLRECGVVGAVVHTGRVVLERFVGRPVRVGVLARELRDHHVRLGTELVGELLGQQQGQLGRVLVAHRDAGSARLAARNTDPTAVRRTEDHRQVAAPGGHQGRGGGEFGLGGRW